MIVAQVSGLSSVKISMKLKVVRNLDENRYVELWEKIVVVVLLRNEDYNSC